MQSYYQMHEYVTSSGRIAELPAHTLRFGSEHDSRGIWERWGLIPASVPMVKLPEPYKNTIDIPGSNQTVDLSRVLLGYPTYKRRTGSWNFYVDLTYCPESGDRAGKIWDPAALYTDIATYLHGQNRTVTLLDDDPDYYYTGIFKVGEMKRGKGFPQISIDYDLEPFKTLNWSTLEDWLWDPFDFLYGEITKSCYHRIPCGMEWPLGYIVPPNVSHREVGGKIETDIVFGQDLIGQGPVFPKIIADIIGQDPMTITVRNPSSSRPAQTFTLHQGLNDNPQIMLVSADTIQNCQVIVDGTGYISFDFRLRRL